MKPERGTVVCSKAGRDKGYFMTVIKVDDGIVYVCDGKERPLENPKKKNVKHIFSTDCVLSDNQLMTNRSIRHALSDFRATGAKGEV